MTIKLRSFTLLIMLVLVSQVALAQGNPPAAPTNIDATANRGRPTITWDDDPNAEWYQVFISTPDFGYTILSQWYEDNVCNSGTCRVTPAIDPTGGSYVVYVRAWGNGAFSTGGTQGWGDPAQLNIPTQPPANITLNINNAGTGSPTLSWQGVPRATWYYLWVGTVVPQTRTEYARWHLAADLGSACGSTGECSVTVNDLPSGSYVTYARVWGPGGFSAGDAFPNWIEGPTFNVGSGSPDELDVVALLNADRAQMGMSCYRINPLLTQAAYDHSLDMRDNIGGLDHTGSDGSRFWERIERSGYPGQARGENIAVGYPNAASVYQGWYNSQGHYDNMFNPNANEIGVARVGNYWTMVTGYRPGVDASCN